MDFPVLVFAFSLPLLWLSARIGDYIRGKGQSLEEVVREDLSVILAASLTLLGLVIGFTFSMAVDRYDQRTKYEAAEANSIGTAFLRASLLPVADGARLRELLIAYVNQRVLFYETRSAREAETINSATVRLQMDLWSAVQAPALAQPNSLMALVVSGVNDVLGSQTNARAAWRNRIPTSAWALMAAIAIFCNALLGYTSRRTESKTGRLFILPVLVSISFFLIADLESPYGGVIHVGPQNLVSVSHSM